MVNFKTLSEMLDDSDFQIYQSETLLNVQYHIINDTGVNVDKMLEYNEKGLFGLTHSDFINNWREFLNELYVFDPDFDDEEDMENGTFDIHINVYDSIFDEINKIEKHHEIMKTLDHMV